MTFGGVTAVNNLSIRVRPGRVHGLIGPNGAGKTTLIDALTGFVSSSSTSLEIAGRDIRKWSPSRRAGAGIARSFQSGELFADLTVEENIAISCDNRSVWRYLIDLVHPGKVRLNDTALVAIRHFKLSADLHKLPEKLPFGQRRLVSIARAIASSPSVLLLDEPAAGLDSIQSRELSDLIRTIAHDWGIGVLLVEHNLDMVLGTCDEITVLTNGTTLLSAASPDEVRADASVAEAYLGVATADSEADDIESSHQLLA